MHMKSFGSKPQGARLERIKASPLWAGERFRNVHPVIPIGEFLKRLLAAVS